MRRKRVDVSLEPEDEAFRWISGLMGAFTIIFILLSLVTGSMGVYLDRSRMVELYNVVADLKVFFHEHYGFHQHWPTERDFHTHMKQMQYAERMAYLSIRDYGLQDGVFWFDVGFISKQKHAGILTIKPVPASPTGSVVWHCGYTADPDTGQAQVDIPRTSINPALLVGTCK